MSVENDWEPDMSIPFPGSPDDMMNIIAALRARVEKLEAALTACKRYAEDHDDEWVPFTVDEALKDTPQ